MGRRKKIGYYRLQITLKLGSTVETMLSYVNINDLGVWWETSSKGNHVKLIQNILIKEIKKMSVVDRYGKRADVTAEKLYSLIYERPIEEDIPKDDPIEGDMSFL